MNSKTSVSLGIALCCYGSVATAHHGFAAHFDPDQLIRIEGTVKQFDFINPHGFLHIDSTNDAGEKVVWVCDLQARTQLVRRGADETLFTVGEHIVVEGFQARRDPLGCEFGKAYFDDGSTFTMRSTDEARTQFADNERIPLEAGETRTIFGNWLRPGMFGEASGRGKRTGTDSITEAGEQAVAAFDPITGNPAVHCEGGSPVFNWGKPGLATSIRQVGDKVIIYHESMDTTRTIHLDQDEFPAEIESNDMGYSIGRYEGDVLIINTRGFSAGVLTGSVVHTDQMIMEERLSTNKENGDLLIEWVAHDPEFYTEPLTGSQTLQSTNKEIIPYECIPGAPTGYHAG